jgi:hypothetical protein
MSQRRFFVNGSFLNPHRRNLFATPRTQESHGPLGIGRMRRRVRKGRATMLWSADQQKNNFSADFR